MLSKNRIAFLRSLQQKKLRRETGLFLAEGTKTVLELMQSDLHCSALYATPEWIAAQTIDLERFSDSIEHVDHAVLERISALNSAAEVLAVFKIPQYAFSFSQSLSDYTLLLDGIRDPGNLGTLIRLADWFGIKQVVCSQDSAEIWNPKTVQATMGSLARIRCFEMDLIQLITDIQEQAKQHNHISIPVYGAFLNGNSIYKTAFSSTGIVIIGNESTGIRDEMTKSITHRITIPCYATQLGAESLNAGVAAGIICAEIRRQLN